MKKIIWTGLIMLTGAVAGAQPIPVEGMAGHEYLFYQHLIAKKFSADSRFGFMHIVNAVSRYQTDPKKGGRPNELMNQVYITAGLSKSFTLLTGMFYNNVTGLRGSAGLQYARPFRQGLLVLLPRADIRHRGSVEFMGMLEYRPVIRKTFKLYSRLQVMSNYGPVHHNRSYQRLRLGVDIRGTQLGIGLNLDEYGRESKGHVNAGIFIRREII